MSPAEKIADARAAIVKANAAAKEACNVFLGQSKLRIETQIEWGLAGSVLRSALCTRRAYEKVLARIGCRSNA